MLSFKECSDIVSMIYFPGLLLPPILQCVSVTLSWSQHLRMYLPPAENNLMRKRVACHNIWKEQQKKLPKLISLSMIQDKIFN